MKKLLILLMPFLIGCASHKKKSEKQWTETEKKEITETIKVPELKATLDPIDVEPGEVIPPFAPDTTRWKDPVSGVEAKQYTDKATGTPKLEVKVPERAATKLTITESEKQGVETIDEKTKWTFQWWWVVLALGLWLAILLAKKLWL
ncbi:hypothetical protein Oweho_3213 [Owenweeksia hongkongensis DSM 17368]|uniref:Lipoprotein n=1 Tax=Owenweeksia hongkongensis (strain DSM 17368 / CIP 108786 / JCM 12287 / NRRL B-23963 / UST20020801) TaxID=926562 RepID=G8R3S7_OWEHD|nr:hypothetical protein [Owenweeksia hongkongensis]AEV34164.1 hypothetical protein Oweho_3213 [Owenweeksia hongkongensis DSM 17368]